MGWTTHTGNEQEEVGNWIEDEGDLSDPCFRVERRTADRREESTVK